MKSRPILFSGPMVRAILDGRKSQTRRIVKTPHADEADAWAYNPEHGLWESGISAGFGQFGVGERVRCPYGAPGDELWVRETFGVVQSLGADRDHDGERYVYRADPASDYQWSGAASQGFRWRPSIFMPRSVSRLTLVVKSVRVERLSAITMKDALEEGGLWPNPSSFCDGFRALNNLAADADPLVWVIEFARKQGGAA